MLQHHQAEVVFLGAAACCVAHEPSRCSLQSLVPSRSFGTGTRGFSLPSRLGETF